LHTGGFIDRNSAIVFNRIYAEFRRNYVLRYLPRGVPRDGWHDVAVTIPRYPRLDVRARHGYFIEAQPSAPVPAPVSTAPAEDTFDALRAAATRGDLPAMRATVVAAEQAGTLAQLIADFRVAGNIWPATPRREFIAALVIAERAARSASANVARDGAQLLARTAPMVRPPLGPDEFDGLWRKAASLLKAPPTSEFDEILLQLSRLAANAANQ
jgi:hypothetical protein